MYFGTGHFGTGYYVDYVQLKVNKNNSSKSSATNSKRKREDDIKPSNTIEELLKQGDELDVEDITPQTLPELIQRFNKSKNKNEELRIKYPDEPTKYMDSEIELHSVIQELHNLASSPELIPILFKQQSHFLTSLTSLLIHENTDIANSIIALLLELTESDDDNDDTNDGNLQICASLVNDTNIACLGMLYDHLNRLDETNDDDNTAMQSSLSILENILDAQPSAASILTKGTKCMTWLIHRMSNVGNTSTSSSSSAADGSGGGGLVDPITSSAADVLALLIQC